MDSEDARTIWLISLLQVCLIVGGTLVVFGWSKLFGYTPDDPTFSKSVHFVRNHGLWLLILPVVWTLLVTLIPDYSLPSWLDGAISIAGIVLVFVLLAFYVFVPLTGYRPRLVMVTNSEPNHAEMVEQTVPPKSDRTGG